MMTQTIRWAPERAILIVDDPAEIYSPLIAPLAERFYGEIVEILQNQGFTVEIDHGRAYTHPDRLAAVWVMHGRGLSRLRHRSKYITVVPLTTKRGNTPVISVERVRSPLNFELAEEDRIALRALRIAKVETAAANRSISPGRN
jgi:hypothetical protein